MISRLRNEISFTPLFPEIINVTDARSIPAAVQWHEGMLLSPQHFQQAELRHSSLQSYVVLSAAPFCWGVRRLRFDEAALVGGRFAVTELEAIMPDGLLVLHPDDLDPAVPKLELDLLPLLADPGSRRIAVHLTVAARSTTTERAGQQRFRQTRGAEVVDENTGDNAVPIPRLLPMLTLHATEGPLQPPPARFVALPLAILESNGQRFSTVEYEPPCLRVDHETLLHQLANKVAADLRSKATEWGVRLSGALSAGRTDSVGDSIATLRTIVRGLPRLEALLRTEVAQPFDVYTALCDIAGDLAVAGGRITLPVLGTYVHADPLAAFKLVTAFVRDALNELHTPHVSVLFDQVRSGRFELVVQPEFLCDHTLVIGVRMGPGQDPSAIRTWFESAVIGAVSRTETMLNNAVIGARREAIDRAPELDLLPPPNMLLFRVAADPAYVAVGEALQVSRFPVDGQAEPMELRLFLPAAAASSAAGTDL
jgi:type VI secretion system protein ImpJ